MPELATLANVTFARPDPPLPITRVGVDPEPPTVRAPAEIVSLPMVTVYEPVAVMQAAVEPVGGALLLQLVPVSQDPPAVFVQVSPVHVTAPAGTAVAIMLTMTAPAMEITTATAIARRARNEGVIAPPFFTSELLVDTTRLLISAGSSRFVIDTRTIRARTCSNLPDFFQIST